MEPQEKKKPVKKTKNSSFKVRYIILFLLGVILVSSLGAVLINEAFKTENGYYTKWKAADALLFFGSVLGAMGTIGLGGLTLWQNEKLREQNERLSQENDATQEKLNQLTVESNAIAAKSNELYLSSNELLLKSNELLLKSNEQSIINKMIEYMNENLARIKESVQDFIDLCRPTELVKNVSSNPIGIAAELTSKKLILLHACTRATNEISASLLSTIR